ncbi:MAG: hypothetical protein Q7J27_13175 [Syntrophales bacterium]|nr:hypothetical protein [Syntrophales bacterium]
MMFDINKTIDYWLESAAYDLETGKSLLEARYPDEKKDFHKKCTEEFTRKKFAEMDKVYKWLTQKLSK